MKQHAVSLPYPSRGGPVTIGRCSCLWSVVYTWGGHDRAEAEAREHIEHAAGSEAITTSEMSGDRLLIEGVSL